MAFCSNCGASVNGKFCQNCGTAVGVGATGQTNYAPPPAGGGYGPASYPPAGAGLTDNVASTLCYTPFLIGFVISIVMLVMTPYNRNRLVRFHALQSLFLHGALFVFWIVVHLLMGILLLITHGLSLFPSFALYPMLSLCFLLLFIFMMVKAYNNEQFKLPVIGNLAQKQA